MNLKDIYSFVLPQRKNKPTIALAVASCMAVMFVAHAQAFQNDNMFTWSFNHYQHYYVDIDGDGAKDLFLHTNTPNLPSMWVQGTMSNAGPIFKDKNSHEVMRLANGQAWDSRVAVVLSGQFNDDSNQDLAVLLPEQQTVLILHAQNGIPLTQAAAAESVDFTWEQSSDEYEYVAGDYNGDGYTDLLALSVNSNEHLLYHFTPEAGFSLAQTIDYQSKWGRNKGSELIVDDFNNDGQDDIFMLANKANKKHFIAFSNNKGKFGKNAIKPLGKRFSGYTWHADEYSTNVVDIDGDGFKELLRMYNSPYMVDLDGETKMMFEPEVPLDEPCKTVYFTVHTNKSGLLCPDGSIK